MRDLQTRQELKDRSEQHKDSMERLGDELKKPAGDMNRVRSLLDRLDLSGGSADGMERVMDHVVGAEDAAETVFDATDAELEGVHQESSDYQGELQERSDVAGNNLDELSEATPDMETDEGLAHVQDAEEAAREDRDAVEEIRDFESSLFQESEAIQAELRNIRNGGG